MSRSHDPTGAARSPRCRPTPILACICPSIEHLRGGGLLLIAAFVLAGLTAAPTTAQAQQQDTLDRVRQQRVEQLRQRREARMRERMRERQKEIQARIRRNAASPAPSGVVEQDSLALVALYDSTDGENWKNNDGWLEGPVSDWYGVTVDGDRVVEVDLHLNQLVGEIPPELSDLSNLLYLNLAANQLTGEVPAELSDLSNLEALGLGNNQLTGEIPAGLSDLSNLETLFLDSNQLTGEIPAGLSDLSNLEALGLEGNELTGEIPPELSDLSSLQDLILDGNELKGEIPAGMSDLSNLLYLNLAANQLTGEVPAGLSDLSNLEVLLLDANQLAGEIPAGLSDLSNLLYLNLAANQLTGEVPAELSDLSNLETLYLNRNELTGEIPVGLSDLSNLEALGLGGNQLTGEIPPELSDLSNLENLSLWGNQLVGEIPPGLSELSNLEDLNLGNNQLTGEIPPGLSELSNLQYLTLGSNQLAGEIPPELSELSNLFSLWLWGNQLVGEIPPGLSELSNLVSLNLGDNQLTGEIPLELSELSNLQYLYLGYNQLTEEIPPELSQLSNLGRLFLNDNQLTGAIPPSFTNLTALSNFGNGTFHFNNTNLCEPSDPEFQAWIDSINDVQSTEVTCSDSGGLVAYYPFDGSANDASGNGNDGALYGNPQFVDGQNGQAISFDGDDDFVQTDSSQSLRVDEKLTFATWVFVDLDEMSRKTLAVQGTVFDTDGNWEIRVRDDGSFTLGKNNVDGNARSDGSISTRQWYHVAITFSSGTTKFYIDGELDSEKDFGASSFNTTSDGIKIGDREYTGDETDDFKGEMDEVRLYDRTLTGEEVQELYDGDGGNLPTITSVEPDPVPGSDDPQSFTINGSGFEEDPNVTLRDLTNGEEYPNREISSFSPTEIVINPVFGTEPSTWSVEVINPNGDSSGAYEFGVVEPDGGETPAAPTGLAAMAGDGEVTLSWDANTESDLDGYNVYRSTSSFSDISGADKVNSSLVGSASYTDTGASNGTKYYYRVTAVDTDENESDLSGEVSATPTQGADPPPVAPTGLQASAGSGQVSLSWDANPESDLAEYRLYRGTSPDPTTQITTIAAGTETYDDTGVTNGTTYYYHVTAADDSGNESDPSGEVSATPEAGDGDLSEITFGGLTIYANEITSNGDGSYLASGNVSVDKVLQLGGDVTVNPDALTLSGDGALFLTDISDRGQVTLYDGEYAFELPNESSTVLGGTGLSAANNLFAVAGLDVHLGGLEILTGNDPGVRVEGALELPKLLGFFEAELNQLQITENEGLALDGKIEVSSVELKNGIATLEELELELNTVAEPSEFEGSAELNLSALGAKIGASASLIEGMLQSVALDVDLSKPVPIPGTGLGLAGAGGEVSGLEEGPPKLKISADLVPSAGGGTGVVSLEDLSLAYTFDTKISGNGSLAVFERSIAEAGLDVFPKEKVEFRGSLGVGSSVPAVQQDILSGYLESSIQAGPPLLLTGQFGATLVVPDLDAGFPFGWIASAAGLPYTVGETDPDPTLEARPLQGTGTFIGGAEILGGDILGIDTGIDFDFEVIYDQGSLDANFGKNLVNLNPENGFWSDAALEIDKAAQRENRFEGKSLIVGAGRTNPKLEVQGDTLRQQFQLREETPTLIVRVQADPKQPGYSVTTPAGDVYSSQGGAAVPGAGYTELGEDNKTFLTIKNPAQGEWSINLPDDGTEYSIDVIGVSPAPTLDLAPPEESGASSVDLSWTANDPDDEVTVDLYYDNDQSGQDGVLIAEGLSEDQTSFTWNTQGVPTGRYHVYAVASTAQNAPVVEYASEPVRLLAAGAPPVPTGVSASPADTALTIAWNGSSEADRYTVYYAAGKNPTLQSPAAGAGDTTAVSFGRIPPGRTYHVAVSATDTTGSESRLSEVATVRYESQTENNVPRITTTDPARQVRESETYQQPIAAEDADGEALSYELARGPEGMAIGSEGTVTWDPEAGRYRIKVRVQDPNGAADSLSYGLRALSRRDATAQIAFGRSSYVGSDATGQLTLTDPELDRSTGLDSQRVQIRTKAAPFGTELLLRETQANSGTFRASFGFKSSAEGRPALDVAQIDTLRVSYQDPFPDTTVAAEAQFFEVEPPRVAPELLSPRGVGSAQPTLKWASLDAAEQYRVQMARDSSFQTLVREETTTEPNLSLNSLDEETTYYWRVRAESIVNGPWSLPTSFLTRAPRVEVAVERSFGSAAGPDDYRLAALPGEANRPLGQAISGEAGTGWQAFWDDGSSEDYLLKYDGSEQFSFRQGRGFWLTSREPWTVEDSVEVVPLKQGSLASIPLHDGWNIVSNPLGKSVAWSAVTQANGGGLQPLWAFNGSFAQVDTFRSARAGEAFYFLNDRGLDSLSVPYPSAPDPKAEGGGKEPLLALTAKQKEAEAPVSTVKVGLDGDAAEGLGRLDQPAPPGRFSQISLRLEAPGEAPPRWRLLATERRPPDAGGEGGHTFRLRLQSKTEGPVQVAASGLDAVKDSQVELLQPSTGRSYDLQAEETVMLEEADSTGLRLVIGNEAYVQDQLEKIVPDEVTLTSYPNPFRTQATIEYTLPEAKEVRITVYDVLGRRVSVLENGRKEAGRHRVTLDGDRLASGVYFGRLETDDQTRTQKITVLR